MIDQIVTIIAAGVIAAASPTPMPHNPAATMSSLPTIESAEALPYPASGTPQPQIVARKTVASVATRLTLDQAVAIAMDRVPALAAARASLASAYATVQLQKTGLAPSISADVSSTGYLSQSGNVTSSSSSVQAVSAGPFSISNSLDLTLSQLIYDGGRVRAQIESATASRNAAASTYRRDAQTVAYNVASAFYTLLSDQRTVAVDAALVTENEVSEELVRAQIRAGTTAGVDLIAQQATTANARTALVSAQGAAQTARVTFATSLGLPADTDVTPNDDSTGLETTGPALTLPGYDDALKSALAQRGDLINQAYQIDAASASLRAERLGFSPTVSLGATKTLASTGRLGDAYRNSASIGLSLSIPIFDQGATKANVALAKASLDLSKAGAATVRAMVESDVRNAMISLVSDRSTLDQARAAYASAQASLAATQGQYRLGITTLPALVTAESSLAVAATGLVTGIYTFRLAQANLRYALGTNLQ
jgi:outer membrane protein